MTERERGHLKMSPESQLLVAQRNAKILLDVNDALFRLTDTRSRNGASEVYSVLFSALHEALAFESEQIVESVSANPKFF